MIMDKVGRSRFASAATCDGGTVTGPLGESQLSVCSNEGPMPVEFNTTSNSGTYTYILCTVNDTIISVLPDSIFDFSGYPDGTYDVWGVSHSGSLTGTVAGTAVAAITSSDGCL
jgi:hypothetical protein